MGQIKGRFGQWKTATEKKMGERYEGTDRKGKQVVEKIQKKRGTKAIKEIGAKGNRWVKGK